MNLRAILIAAAAAVVLVSANVTPRVYCPGGCDYYFGWPFEWGCRRRNLEYFTDDDPRFSSPLAIVPGTFEYFSVPFLIANCLVASIALLSVVPITKMQVKFQLTNVFALLTALAIAFAANHYSLYSGRELLIACLQLSSWCLLCMGLTYLFEYTVSRVNNV